MVERNKKHFYISMIVGFIIGILIYRGRSFVGTLLLTPVSGIIEAIVF